MHNKCDADASSAVRSATKAKDDKSNVNNGKASETMKRKNNERAFTNTSMECAHILA